MKTKLTLALLALFFLTEAAQGPPIPYGFSWTYPTEENTPAIFFKLYRTKTPQITNSWAYFLIVQGPATNVVTAVDSGMYYQMTASNTLAQTESDPSNVVIWQRPPGLKIDK